MAAATGESCPHSPPPLGRVGRLGSRKGQNGSHHKAENSGREEEQEPLLPGKGEPSGDSVNLSRFGRAPAAQMVAGWTSKDWPSPPPLSNPSFGLEVDRGSLVPATPPPTVRGPRGHSQDLGEGDAVGVVEEGPAAPGCPAEADPCHGPAVGGGGTRERGGRKEGNRNRVRKH